MPSPGHVPSDDVHSLWHPFADMGSVGTQKLVLDRAEGCWIHDEDDRRYLDATASLWCTNAGHGRPEIAEAVAAQLNRLDFFSTFGDYANRPALDVAARLAALSPLEGTKVFFGSGGGDMLEAAAKIARAHFALTGRPERTHLISRELGYHGTHGFGTSMGGIEANTAGWGRLVPDVSVVAKDSPEALEQRILDVGAERVAAFFCEPVIGAGGVHLPQDGYLEAVADVCHRHGVLFVADCVVCAFGRLGTWFGVDRWPVVPDMIAVAKGITSGTMPLGALLVSGEVADPFFTGEPGAPVFRHGQTYAGHPACCAAALATMDVLERDDLIVRGRDLEGHLRAALEPLTESPLVGELRAGTGLLAGVDLAPAVHAAVPGAPVKLQLACREAGVLLRPLLRGIAISPPLSITEDEIDTLGAMVADGLERFASSLPAEVVPA